MISYFKQNEVKRYLFWGIVTAFVNVGSYQILIFWEMDYKTSNIMALSLSRIFSYIVNKLFVFKTSNTGFLNLIGEMARFLYARMVTFLLDFFGVIFLVEKNGIEPFAGKCIVAMLVIVVNYFFCKCVVFKE